VIGVVNVSPESHNVDSVVAGAREAVARARRLAEQGAAIIDVGGRSTHFGVEDVGWRVELRRVLPAVTALKDAGFVVSIDTTDGRVARAGLTAGADMCNASDGMQSAEMLAAVAEARVPVIVPYLTGPTPATSGSPAVDDPVGEMLPWFARTLGRLAHAGVDAVVLDPGVGYAHRGARQELRDLLQRRVFAELGRIAALGHPVLAPVFRKPLRSFSLELIRLACANGATFLRAHDPRLVYEALDGRTCA
jgi:dihydropteroate synthase